MAILPAACGRTPAWRADTSLPIQFARWVLPGGLRTGCPGTGFQWAITPLGVLRAGPGGGRAGLTTAEPGATRQGAPFIPPWEDCILEDGKTAKPPVLVCGLPPSDDRWPGWEDSAPQEGWMFSILWAVGQAG